MDVLLLADTHIGPRYPRRTLPAAVLDAAGRADVVLHAGDVVEVAVLARLATHAPVHAVLGNNDGGLRLPARLEVELAGCRVAMVHDSGPAAGRAARLRCWFPGADVVVFGHSHLPWHVADDPVDGGGRVQHHVNPGSPTERRMAPQATYAWLTLDAGRVVAVRHVDVAP